MKIKNLKILFFLLLILGLVSCGSKTGSSSVKLKVGNLIGAGSSSTLNGGVLIMGRSLDSAERIRVGIPSGASDIVLDLKKAKWEFAAIAWEGSASGAMTGVVRCGFSGVVEIANDYAAINFNMTRDACKGGVTSTELIEFSDNNFLEDDGTGSYNQFKSIYLRSCLTLGEPSALNGSTCTVAEYGLTKSFKIQIEGEQKKNGAISPLMGLSSNCYQTETKTNLRLPVGTGGNSFIKYTLMAYSSTDCSGSSIAFPFWDKSPYQGFNGASLKSNLTNFYSSPSYVSMIAIEHNPTTFNEYSIADNFFFGSGVGLDQDVTASILIPDNEYGSLKEVSAADTRKITLYGTSSTGINKYDEILWYVNYEKSGQCSATGITKNRFTTGMFGFALVVDKIVGADTTLVLDKSFLKYRYNDGSEGDLELPDLPTRASTCSIQVVKVRQYRNLNFPVASMGITPPAFTSGIGGIVAIKVKDSINVTGDNAFIKSSGTGVGSSYSTGTIYSAATCLADKKRCVKMFDASYSLPGGLVFLQAKQMINAQSTPLNFYLKSEGGSTFASGGAVLSYIGDIRDTGYNFYVNVGAKDGPSGPGDGFFELQHCSKSALTSLSGIYNAAPVQDPFSVKCF